MKPIKILFLAVFFLTLFGFLFFRIQAQSNEFYNVDWNQVDRALIGEAKININVNLQGGIRLAPTPLTYADSMIAQTSIDLDKEQTWLDSLHARKKRTDKKLNPNRHREITDSISDYKFQISVLKKRRRLLRAQDPGNLIQMQKLAISISPGLQVSYLGPEKIGFQLGVHSIQKFSGGGIGSSNIGFRSWRFPKFENLYGATVSIGGGINDPTIAHDLRYLTSDFVIPYRIYLLHGFTYGTSIIHSSNFGIQTQKISTVGINSMWFAFSMYNDQIFPPFLTGDGDDKGYTAGANISAKFKTREISPSVHDVHSIRIGFDTYTGFRHKVEGGSRGGNKEWLQKPSQRAFNFSQFYLRWEHTPENAHYRFSMDTLATNPEYLFIDEPLLVSANTIPGIEVKLMGRRTRHWNNFFFQDFLHWAGGYEKPLVHTGHFSTDSPFSLGVGVTPFRYHLGFNRTWITRK